MLSSEVELFLLQAISLTKKRNYFEYETIQSKVVFFLYFKENSQTLILSNSDCKGH